MRWTRRCSSQGRSDGDLLGVGDLRDSRCIDEEGCHSGGWEVVVHWHGVRALMTCMAVVVGVVRVMSGERSVVVG